MEREKFFTPENNGHLSDDSTPEYIPSNKEASLDTTPLEREEAAALNEARKEVARAYAAEDILARNVEKYLTKNNNVKELLTPELENYLMTKFQELRSNWSYDKVDEIAKIRHEVMERNQKIVTKMAYNRYNLLHSGIKRRIGLEDLFQQGNLGLLEAMHRFEPERGLKLSTYSVWWIRQSMNRYIEETGQDFNVPSHVQEVGIKVHRAKQELAAQEITPTLEEIARQANLSLKDVKRGTYTAPPVDNLDGGLMGNEGETLGLHEHVPSSSTEPLQAVLNQGLVDFAEQMIKKAKLTPDEEMVIRFRKGLGDREGEGMTLVDIRRYLIEVHGRKVTGETIRQWEVRALRKLKRLRWHRDFKNAYKGDWEN